MSLLSELNANRKVKAELCIHGYVRLNYHGYTQIPAELMQLCLSMYFLLIDTWNKSKSNSFYKFSKDAIASVHKPTDDQASNSLLNAFGKKRK